MSGWDLKVASSNPGSSSSPSPDKDKDLVRICMGSMLYSWVRMIV